MEVVDLILNNTDKAALLLSILANIAQWKMLCKSTDAHIANAAAKYALAEQLRSLEARMAKQEARD